MLKLVAEVSSRYQPRHYVVADTDVMSTDKVYAMEKNWAQCKGDCLVRCVTYLLMAKSFL